MSHPMQKYKIGFLSLLVAGVLYHSLFASEMKPLVLHDSLAETNWHPIVYKDEYRSFRAKFPGILEETLKNERLCFFQSAREDVRYAIFFKPDNAFSPPATLEEFLERFKHLDSAQVIALKPVQPRVVYLLQIHMFNEMDGAVRSILRVYATENTLYFAMVDGGDLSFSGDFFHSLEFEK